MSQSAPPPSPLLLDISCKGLALVGRAAAVSPVNWTCKPPYFLLELQTSSTGNTDSTIRSNGNAGDDAYTFGADSSQTSSQASYTGTEHVGDEASRSAARRSRPSQHRRRGCCVHVLFRGAAQMAWHPFLTVGGSYAVVGLKVGSVNVRRIGKHALFVAVGHRLGVSRERGAAAEGGARVFNFPAEPSDVGAWTGPRGDEWLGSDSSAVGERGAGNEEMEGVVNGRDGEGKERDGGEGKGIEQGGGECENIDDVDGSDGGDGDSGDDVGDDDDLAGGCDGGAAGQVITYEGRISRRVGEAVFEFDGDAQAKLFLAHWGCNDGGVGIRVGSIVRATHVHLVYVEGRLEGFAACMRSSIQVTAFSPLDTPHVPWCKHLSILKDMYVEESRAERERERTEQSERRERERETETEECTHTKSCLQLQHFVSDVFFPVPLSSGTTHCPCPSLFGCQERWRPWEHSSRTSSAPTSSPAPETESGGVVGKGRTAVGVAVAAVVAGWTGSCRF